MNPLVRWFLNPLAALAAMLTPSVTLRPCYIIPGYSEQLMVSFYAGCSGPQTHFEVRHRNFGRAWVYEPLVAYDWNPTLAPAAQVWVYGLGPETWFEIEARSVDVRTGGVSEWARTMMRTLP